MYNYEFNGLFIPDFIGIIYRRFRFYLHKQNFELYVIITSKYLIKFYIDYKSKLYI